MLFLVICAFLAGFVDSIVGGGGLIQVPALFVFLPPSLAAQVPAVLGTNKFSSICGTAVATFQYARKVRLNGRMVFPAAVGAFVFSPLGARAVSLLNPKAIKPLILLLLLGVAIYIFTRKKTAPAHSLSVAPKWHPWISLGFGSAIGFYDGFFGPGTGTFLIICFVGFFALDFLRASASAKAVNLSTNIAAVLWFAGTGNILWAYALPMAVANISGSFVGSRLAILKGSEFVRKFFLGVVLLLIIRFAWELARGT
jgi:uncharacterized membrane protein YfcA